MCKTLIGCLWTLTLSPSRHRGPLRRHPFERNPDGLFHRRPASRAVQALLRRGRRRARQESYRPRDRRFSGRISLSRAAGGCKAGRHAPAGEPRIPIRRHALSRAACDLRQRSGDGAAHFRRRNSPCAFRSQGHLAACVRRRRHDDRRRGRARRRGRELRPQNAGESGGRLSPRPQRRPRLLRTERKTSWLLTSASSILPRPWRPGGPLR